MSFQRLGEEVGLSPASVHERVRKLEQRGVLRGYHAELDARALGFDVTAFIGVSIHHPRGIEAIEQRLHEEPQVLESHHVTGGHTLLLKVRMRDTRELRDLIFRLRGFEGVERTETMVVLSTQREGHALPIEEAPRAHEASVLEANSGEGRKGKAAAKTKSGRTRG